MAQLNSLLVTGDARFLNSVTAPTQTSGDNSNKVATTAYVDTAYSSKAAVSGGADVSLVTTGEKYTWNNKSNLAIGTTATTAAAGNHTHATSIAESSGIDGRVDLEAGGVYLLTAGGSSVKFRTPQPYLTLYSGSTANPYIDIPINRSEYTKWMGKTICVYVKPNSQNKLLYACECFIPPFWMSISESIPMSGRIIAYDYDQLNHVAFCENNYQLKTVSGSTYIRFYKGYFYTWNTDEYDSVSYMGNATWVISTDYKWYAIIR